MSADDKETWITGYINMMSKAGHRFNDQFIAPLGATCIESINEIEEVNLIQECSNYVMWVANNYNQIRTQGEQMDAESTYGSKADKKFRASVEAALEAQREVENKAKKASRKAKKAALKGQLDAEVRQLTDTVGALKMDGLFLKALIGQINDFVTECQALDVDESPLRAFESYLAGAKALFGEVDLSGIKVTKEKVEGLDMEIKKITGVKETSTLLKQALVEFEIEQNRQVNLKRKEKADAEARKIQQDEEALQAQRAELARQAAEKKKEADEIPIVRKQPTAALKKRGVGFMTALKVDGIIDDDFVKWAVGKGIITDAEAKNSVMKSDGGESSDYAQLFKSGSVKAASDVLKKGLRAYDRKLSFMFNVFGSDNGTAFMKEFREKAKGAKKDEIIAEFGSTFA
jgi:hypothetical protein